MPERRVAGFSLVELLTVLTIIGILAVLAAPTLRGMIRYWRVNAALRQFAADVSYARVLAVRSGTGAAVRYETATSCTPSGRASTGFDRYSVVLLTTPERIVKSASVRPEGGALCMESNRGAVQFNSRGIPSPPSNQTVWAREDSYRDSLTISAVGRVMRRY